LVNGDSRFRGNDPVAKALDLRGSLRRSI
jgi:hypothetical protein